jgi:uncharacterized protein (DUF433 family)
MAAVPVYISPALYDKLRQKADETHRSPDELVENLLRRELDHPYIAVESSRFGEQAVIKGTRISVATIVSYQRLGYTPETITNEILPHLELAQVQDALSYYTEHTDDIDRELADDTEAKWMHRLREMAGSDEVYARMTGGRYPLNG